MVVLDEEHLVNQWEYLGWIVKSWMLTKNHPIHGLRTMKYPLGSIVLHRKNLRGSSNLFFHKIGIICLSIHTVFNKNTDKTPFICSDYTSDTSSVFCVFPYKTCHMVCGSHVMWLLTCAILPLARAPLEMNHWVNQRRNCVIRAIFVCFWTIMNMFAMRAKLFFVQTWMFFRCSTH